MQEMGKEELDFPGEEEEQLQEDGLGPDFV